MTARLSRYTARSAGDRTRGFTLIEVLVAMMIMVMIILSLSAVFKQMTASWGVGMRKIKVNMQGRAAMDHMAQELCMAVADDVLVADLRDNVDRIYFFTMDTHVPTNRAMRRVTYDKSGRKLRRSVWPVKWDCGGSYPDYEGEYAHTLVGSVNSLRFYTSDGQMHTTNLPDWVDIEMQLDQNSRISRTVVRSLGPDGMSPEDITGADAPGTEEDDIVSE